MTSYIHFRCPCCHGSQYRTSVFDVSEKILTARNAFFANRRWLRSITWPQHVLPRAISLSTASN